ncbi:MAG: pyruvate dehydrogenase complex dihydrolipoamide acetyltransferase, partial [Armatimonadota bacterium]
MVEVTMPKMGDAMEEGTLVEWLKKEGEKVAEGEPIASIQTDKATVEMESPGTGTLAGFLIQEGDSVPVGEPIALVLGDGESVPDGWGAGKEREAAPSPAPAKAHKREQHTERP